MKAAAIAALGLLIVLPAHLQLSGKQFTDTYMRQRWPLHNIQCRRRPNLQRSNESEKSAHPDCGEYRNQAGDHSAPC